jgi:hypothetical protein
MKEESLLKQSNCIICEKIIASYSVQCKTCYAEWHTYCVDEEHGNWCPQCVGDDLHSFASFIKREVSWWKFNDIGPTIFIFIGMVGVMLQFASVLIVCFTKFDDNDANKIALILLIVSMVLILPCIVWWSYRINLHQKYLRKVEKAVCRQ